MDFKAFVNRDFNFTIYPIFNMQHVGRCHCGVEQNMSGTRMDNKELDVESQLPPRARLTFTVTSTFISRLNGVLHFRYLTFLNFVSLPINCWYSHSINFSLKFRLPLLNPVSVIIIILLWLQLNRLHNTSIMM